MIEYYIYFIVMWVLAYVEFLSKRSVFIVPISIFFLFLALRVETGYDWPVYQNMFYSLSEVNTFSDLIERSSEYQQEIGFVVFSFLLYNIVDDFQIVIFMIAIIETYALYQFLKLTTKSPSLVLAIIGTWLLFTLYFSVLRQGLAVSFFLLFVVYINTYKDFKAFIVLIAALSIQVSSAVYFLLYFISYVKIKKRFLIGLFILSLIMGYFSQSIALTVFTFVQHLGIPVISSKMSWYIDGRVTEVHIFDRIFVYTYAVVMFMFLYYTWDTYKNNLMIKLSFFAMIFIFVQLIFIEYPLIRNRLQYVSFMMQFILIINYFYYKNLSIRFITLSCMMIVLLSYYTLMLNKAYSVVFVPYQDSIRYKVFEYRSTGKDRQLQMFDMKYNK